MVRATEGVYDMEAILNFTNPPPTGVEAGVVVPATAHSNATGSTTLRSHSFKAQHGAVPIGFAGLAIGRQSNIFNPGFAPVMTTIHDARILETPAKIETHGFELLDHPLSNDQGSGSLGAAKGQTRRVPDAFADPSAIARSCRALEDALLQRFEADAAIAYCHFRRSKAGANGNPIDGAGFAEFLHSDYSDISWPALLPDIVAQGLWAETGPPGVPPEAAARAASARRYSVITTWRYLGPAPICRHSHLAVCAPASIRSGGLLRYTLVSGAFFGGNFRLIPNQFCYFYYFPNMTPDEALCFTAFDSAHAEIFASAPIPTCLHGAFADPEADPTELPRESIDIRVLLIWD
jgi:hypothetical protein